VPATTFAPIPAAWSLIMFSQVRPRLGPKYLRFGRAWMDGTATTNRIPSTEATCPPPQACASGMVACRSISGPLAAA
jgi:hypothetical protein